MRQLGHLITGASDGWTLPQACGEGRPGRLGRGRWVIGSESWEVWAAGILSSPRSAQRGFWPPFRSLAWNAHTLAWPGPHSPGISLPPSRPPPWLSPALPRPSGLPRWYGGSQGLPLPQGSAVRPGDTEGLSGPPRPGGEDALLLTASPCLIPATRASLKAQLCPTPSRPFDPPGLLLCRWANPNPDGSQGIFSRPHRGLIPRPGLQAGKSSPQYSLLDK